MKAWQIKENKLTKTFEMQNFDDIIDRLDGLRKVANQMNHHPDFKVFGYRKVQFELSTHSAGGVTDKDRELAKEIDRLMAPEVI